MSTPAEAQFVLSDLCSTVLSSCATGQDSVRGSEWARRAAAKQRRTAWRRHTAGHWGTAQKSCLKTAFAVFAVFRAGRSLLCRCAHSPAAEPRRTASWG